MSLFDMIKGKAEELLGGVGDKVAELTGIDVPGREQISETTTGLAEAGQNLTDTAVSTGQSLADTATEAGWGVPETTHGVGGRLAPAWPRHRAGRVTHRSR
ncbi:hypothetical protein LWP59_17995 [Amycolatopsis acidiphila]|uniref:CsbD family protein n=1 Tax=Amycolatopsis acidiphila TaxID=715473 RepID=A0A558ANS4_9PSEU|nr:hypothetical protein [Amycolatopsis acidiphila]TVT25906.1 hypothetical protein FNH06_00235 [Amycolatopsis acidiphila]UIJ63393.1 hypothetical protein LWP59_17995 [Amycolatopsis acidiphila]GHG75361.1 hypothetical protein GCM10017788_40200 [Amycolatopsis acidiphila]